MASEPTLTTEAAIAWVIAQVPDARIISSCGFVTRDLFGRWDRAENFYLVGAMGMALPVGIGVAITQPDRTVVVLEGDGAFLMNLGAVSVVGALRPANLIHVILDNEMHESTGGQSTVSMPDLARLLPAAGYGSGASAATGEELAGIELRPGPSYLHLRVRPRSEPGPRVTISPSDLVDRFTRTLEPMPAQLRPAEAPGVSVSPTSRKDRRIS